MIVGFSFKTSRTPQTSVWASRGKVTEPGLKLAMSNIIMSFSKAATCFRRKMDKASMEQRVEMAALAVTLCNEVMQKAPIPFEVLEEEPSS